MVRTLIKQLPEATWGRDDDGWVVRKQALLLLDGHTSDYGAQLNLVRVLHWDNRLYVIFDLDSQFSSGTYDESLDGVELLITLLKALAQ